MRHDRWRQTAALLVALVGAAAACGENEVDMLDSPVTTAGAPATSDSEAVNPPATTSPSTTAAASSTTAPEVTSTTSSTTSSTTVPPATTVVPTTTPATTQTSAPAPTEGVSVAYAGGAADYPAYIVAVWSGTGWAYPTWNDDGTPREMASTGAMSTTALGLVAPITGTTYGALDYFCYADDLAPRLVLPAGASLADSTLTVTADWNIQPRPANLSPEPGVFAEAASASVDAAESDAAGEGVVTQSVDVDLQGDGDDDAVYIFERHSDFVDGLGTEGDFALVVAMYPDADGVFRHHVLFELYEHPEQQPGDIDAEVLAVADLNGDGIMEVVIEWTYWETAVVDVYAFDDSGQLVLVSGGGCGS